MRQRVLITEYLQSSLDPDSDSAYEVTYYLWRRNRRPWLATGRRPGRYSYEIWVVAIPGRLKADGKPSAESASSPGANLKEAIADVAAGRVTGAVWKIDGLSEGMAARLIGMPEELQGLVDGPLDAGAGAVGLPAPVAAFTGDVAGTLLLKPVMGRVGNVMHGLEIVGAIAGAVTGLPGLSALCLKHLVRDKITALLGKAFDRAISGADKAPDRQPPATAGPETRGRLDGPAIASPQPGTSEVPSATAGREPRRPRGRARVQPAHGRLRTHEERLRAAAPTLPSQPLRSGRSSYRGGPAAAGRPTGTPSHDWSAEPPLPPYPPMAAPPLPADPPMAAPPLSRTPNACDSRRGRDTGMSR